MNKDQIKSLILNLDLFNGLSEKDLDELATIMDFKTYKANEVIIREGDEQDKDVYVICKGTVVTTLQTKKNEDDANINVMKEGQIFGELALISNEKRSATIQATSDVDVVYIPKALFDKLVERNNHLGMIIYRNIAKILSGRIQKTNKMLRHTILWGW